MSHGAQASNRPTVLDSVARSRADCCKSSEWGCVVTRTFLVYTLTNGGFGRVDKGLCSFSRWSWALHHRVSGFIVPIVSRSQRPPHHLVDHASRRANALLRVDDDARVGVWMPGALFHRA